MSVRKEVQNFVALGRLPDSDASEEAIALHKTQLHAIKGPVTDEEAALLAQAFGPDECFGLAWTLLHLIETAPGECPIKVKPSEDDEWMYRLWQRAHRRMSTELK